MSVFSFTGYTWRSYLEKTDNWRQIYKETNLNFCTLNSVSNSVENKDLIGDNRGSHLCEMTFNYFWKISSWNWEKIKVLRNFNSTWKIKVFFFINIISKWKYISICISSTIGFLRSFCSNTVLLWFSQK